MKNSDTSETRWELFVHRLTAHGSRLITLVLSLLLLHAFSLKACPGAKKHAFSIGYKNVFVNSPMPSIGDTAWLSFNYTSTYTGPATLHFDFPGSVVPFDQLPGETERDLAINVDSGITQSDSIPFKLADYGASMLQFGVSADSVTSSMFQMASTASDHFEFEFTATSFQVFPDDFWQNGLDSAHDDEVPPGGASCNISGTVTYDDGDQFNRAKGVYGASVVLLFQKQDEDGTWQHPYTGEINGILHEGKIDVNGNFSFSFTGPVDWSAYKNVILLVSTSSDAVFNLMTPSGQAIATTFDDGFGHMVTGSIGTFTRAEGKILAVNDLFNITYTNVAIKVNPADGAIMRDMELSWEFEHARGVAQPGAITVWDTKLPSTEAGEFNLTYEFLKPNYAQIQIDHDNGSPFLCTVSHEYGHYQNYFNMGPASYDDWNNSSSDFKEGFAEFHQFAVRNYAAAKYAEYSPWYDDNQEGYDGWYGCQGPFSVNPRFGGIRYQGSTLAPNAAAFSCVLWNVYDKYDDDNFRAPQYQDKDNDDVGLTTRVIGILNDWPNAVDIDSYMRSLYLASPSEENSIASIYDFMLVSGPMRPANVGNLWGGRVYNPDQWEIEWEYSEDYGSVCYENPPTGVHIYQWDGTYQSDGSKTWVLMATVAYPALLAKFTYNANYQNLFMVDAYNASGDAENAPTIDNPAWKVSTGNFDGENNESLDVTVHPNPASNQARICIADLPARVPVSVQVVNQDGEVVTTLYDATPDAELGLCLTLDCSKLASGTYYAQVQNAIMGRAVKISVQH